MNQYAGYLFVHFTGEHETGEQVYFALSRDGLHWQDLNAGAPVLCSGIGEKGVRDPFVCRSPIDGCFYLIATDLRIANGKGWMTAKTVGSRDIIVWRSKDLVNWSQEWAVTVGVPDAGCVWAPEAVYDEERDAILVFWASNMPIGEQRRQRIYAAYTRDFKEFTEAFPYIEREEGLIDTTILKEKGRYYRYSKEAGQCIRIDCGDSLTGSFQKIESSVLENLFGVEGPVIFRFYDREEWCLLVDRFKADEGYLPLLTKEPGSGEFRILTSEEYDMGVSKKRHGSVLLITEEEYTRLVEVYGR